MNNKENSLPNNITEKKIIVYLITIFIIFVYISIYWIHFIIDRAVSSNNTFVDIKFEETISEFKDEENDYVDDVYTNGTNAYSNKTVDAYYIFKVFQGQNEWSELKELDVFKNKYYNNQAIIAPGVKGDYTFKVEGAGDSDFNYDVTFTNENIHNVNLKFKLKRNGQYVAGDENTWVDYKDMDLKNLYLKTNTSDVFTIEWEWIDADNDTQVGETYGAKYKLFIKVDAVAIYS